MYTYELVRHIPSGCLYFAAFSPNGIVCAISDDISQRDAAAITADPQTWPEWAGEEQVDWARNESLGTYRIVGEGAGL